MSDVETANNKFHKFSIFYKHAQTHQSIAVPKEKQPNTPEQIFTIFPTI